MNSQVHQTLGIISADGSVTTSIIASSDMDNPNSNLIMDHVYGLVESSPSSSSSPTVSTTTASNMQASSLAHVTPSSTPPMRGRSKVWNEFTVTPDGKKVTCRRCGDALAYSNSHSTSSMLKHLKRKHSVDLYPTASGNENDSDTGVAGGGSSSFPSTDPRFRSPGSSHKRANNKSAGGTSAKPIGKKHIPKDAEELDTSIQHGPLLFRDPCVRMKWTDHSDTFLRTFSALYSDESYTDVTLVVEKNHFFKAHRLILSSASEFFDDTFKMTPQGQHPIIFLKDVKAMDLRILLDFIYKGEVSIPPSMIPGLVKIGSDLRVRGLSDFVWNEQLASSVFQPRPQQQQQQQQQLHDPREQISQNLTENRRFIAQQETVNTACSLISPAKVVHHQPVRTLIRQPGNQQQNGVPQQQHQQQPKTYSRIVNLRPTASTSIEGGGGGGGISSNGQIISGDLSAVCSTVANTFPSMKRIRIVTSEPRLSPAAPHQIRQVTTGDGFPKAGSGGRDNGVLAAAHTTSTPQEAETVLMVTNEGETLLSTTQGGVTVFTPPNTAMSLPSTSMTSGQQQQSVIHHEHHQQQLHPVITAITSQAHQQQSRGDSGGSRGVTTMESDPDLDEVVYSIAEISEGGDEAHEVLMHQDQEMICGDESADDDEPVDKKPFMQT